MTDVDCDKLIKSFTTDELKDFVDINNSIDDLTFYGLREEYVKEESTFLHWSNGSRRWIAAHPESGFGERVRPGNTVTLDANQMITPHPYEFVDKISGCLKDLPLYACSFEAKQRGEVDPKIASLCWALKQLERIKKEKWQDENR
jgi:hypothetical protein